MRETSLVAIQEHAMHVHGYRQSDLMLTTKRLTLTGIGYIWTMPDGVDWLKAIRDEGE